MRYLVGRPIVAVSASPLRDSVNLHSQPDTMTINLEFDDGSHGSVHYFSNGSKAFPKERVEVFSEGRVLQLDNFSKLNISGDKSIQRFNLFDHLPKFSGQNKGHELGFKAFLDSIREGGCCPISFDEIDNTMQATFAAVESAKTGTKEIIQQ